MEGWPIKLEPHALAWYAHNLELADLLAALASLARALAASPKWQGISGASLIVRPNPQPVLGVLVEDYDVVGNARLAALGQGLNDVLSRLCYVDYMQAEQDCALLAAQLVERFGHDELRRFRFTAIPRGGLIVLGMLAYTLGLKRTQLEPPHLSDVPLVVVDDCALTGARFGRFLERCESQQVIFAHLYSHPDLRAAIEAQEPRVVACLSAHDLHDHGPERLGDEYPAWRERWLARLEGPRYWIGQPDHVCFAWNEPDRFFWNPVTEQVESGWCIVPPEFCLKHRPAPGMESIPVQVQPEGKGPLKPSQRVLFGEFEGRIVVGDLEAEKSFCLADVAADMWRAIVEYGNVEDVVAALLREYDVDEATLQVDLRAFVGDLLTRGLLEQSDAANKAL
jgi:hypothetical protein